MPFVLDASIAACWAFDDEDHPVAALALERVRTDEARVRAYGGSKCATLIVSERRGRLTEGDTATFLHGLAHLGVSVDRSPEEADVLRLLATAALQSMTPHILSSHGARVRPLQRLTRLLQLPHAPNGCAY